MIFPSRLLPLLVASVPFSHSFAPSHPSITSRASISHCALQVAPDKNTHEVSNNKNTQSNDVMEHVGKVAVSALLAFTLSFSGDVPSFVPSANAAALSAGPSITLSRADPSDDEAAIKFIEEETRAAEKEAKADAKKAKIEATRKAYFDYDAKMAEQQEARIEKAEREALLEAKNDKELAQKLKLREEKAEKEAALATTKEERAAKQKEARELLKKEKLAERKERKAERLEKIFLAEEAQEKKIVKQKEDAEAAEEQRYEAAEEEYKKEAELAKEDELELSLAKSLLRKK